MFDGRLIAWVKLVVREFFADPEGWEPEQPEPAPDRPAWMFFLDL